MEIMRRKKIVCLPFSVAFWGRDKANMRAAIIFTKDSFFEALELKTIVKEKRKSSYAEFTKAI